MMVFDEKQQRALKTYVRLMRCVGSVSGRMHKHLKKQLLTSSQFGVLEALHSLGPLCQKEISQKILKSGGNITMVIDNLEKQDFVKRVRDKHDRRKFIVELTEKGNTLIEQVLPNHAEVAEQVFSVLSAAELEEFGRMLKLLGKGESYEHDTKDSTKLAK